MLVPSRWWRPTPRTAVVVVVLYVLAMLVALVLGAYDPWFPAAGPRGAQGADFFCVPKAYNNLFNGVSAFDTWGAPSYGPYTTWFVLHPAVAIWVGGYLAWLSPWVAYGVFALATLSLLTLAATLFAHHAADDWHRLLVYAAFLASPVTYALLFVGNIHGIVVLAAAWLLVGLHELGSAEYAEHAAGDQRVKRPALGIAPDTKVWLGLLLSLFSKPALGLVLPAMFIVRRTRRMALGVLGAYGGVSLTFLVVPYLNPESIGLVRTWQLVRAPGWVAANLNIYVNQFRLTPEMRDNAMHWLHMVAQSGFAWDHVQVLSLPALVKGLTGATLPLQVLALAPVLLAPGLWLLRSEVERLRCLGWLVVLALSSHFLGYSIAWEYQYTQLLLVTAALVSLPLFGPSDPSWLKVLALSALLTLHVPSPYALVRAGGLSTVGLAVVRSFRLLPAVALTAVALWVLTNAYRRSRQTSREAAPGP